MSKITLDPELKKRLNGLDEQLEVCDESGVTIGMYLPLEDYKKLLLRGIEIPFSEEEIDQLRNQPGGRTLDEIWQDLKQS